MLGRSHSTAIFANACHFFFSFLFLPLLPIVCCGNVERAVVLLKGFAVLLAWWWANLCDALPRNLLNKTLPKKLQRYRSEKKYHCSKIVYPSKMSSNNNIQQTFSLASPCTVDEATVSNAVFKTGNRFFVNVNSKFLGTFDDERSARAKALSYSEERCLSIKRAVLQY